MLSTRSAETQAGGKRQHLDQTRFAADPTSWSNEPQRVPWCFAHCATLRRVILGAEAGRDLRHALSTGRPPGRVTTSLLWEIGHLLCHRANMNPRELMNAQHEEVVEVLQNSRRRKLETLRGLKDTRLY